MQETNLILFNLESRVALEKEIYEHYGEQVGFIVSQISSLEALTKSVAASSKALVICKIENKTDLVLLIKFLKGHRRKIKNSAIKVAAFNLTHNRKVEKLLISYGCHDLLTLAMGLKTCCFKIDFWSRGLKDEQVEQVATNKIVRASKNQTLKGPPKKIQVLSLEATEQAEDIWIFKNKKDHKRILQRWLIKMLGPSPHICFWEKVEAQKWKLIFNDVNDAQALSIHEGDWFFIGEKPEFDWKQVSWKFYGTSPRLYFQNSAKTYDRFFYKERNLNIYENSKSVLAKERLLIENCDIKFFNKVSSDKNYYYGKVNLISEARDNKRSSVKEEDLGGHYQGKVTQVDLDSHYNGKIKQVFDENEEKGGVRLTSDDEASLELKEENTSESSVGELTESGVFKIRVKQTLKGQEFYYECFFEDFYETELVVLFKKEIELELSPVKVDMEFSYRKESVEIKDILGQIIEIEDHNRESRLAVIDLVNLSEMDKKRLLKLYQKRQSAINEFMLLAKGY